MGRKVHVACLQTAPRPDFDSAIAELLDLAGRAVANGAEFVAMPEYCGGLRSEGPRFAPPAAGEDAHPVLKALRDFAADRNVWLLIGSIAVLGGPNGRIFNRGYVVDSRGLIRARYDKLHMFDIRLSESESYRESASVAPGGKAVLVETPFGEMGMSTCYDLRFPNLYRSLARAGAEILAVPAAFTRATGEAHWHVLNRARAIENGSFVISPCAVGAVPGGGECYGHSLIVDPWGTVLADGGNAPGIAEADIDISESAAARQRIPSLGHDVPFEIEEWEKAA